VGLERYHGIIPDWDRFITTCSTPLPTVIRANTLRIAPSELRTRLEEKGFTLVPYPGLPWLFRVEEDCVTKTIEHWLGLFYSQEATQALPVLALAPQPGERVLDMCAAPGGKTTQIAAEMENSGLLVANEPNGRRQQALLSNLNRLSVLNAAVTAYRGEMFPLGEKFDRVLIDAPCSAEGTLRKSPSLRDGATEATIRRLAGIQRRLILRGYELLKPGGVLVYSTCTFAPEEDEAVVSFLLSSRDAHVEPLALPLPHSPGITAWNGEEFSPEVAGCARIYPHHFDSGGGFIARIRRG